MRTLDEQIEAMARLWADDFKLIRRDNDCALWEGSLAPASRSYKVQVFARVPLAIENATIQKAQPLVQVLAPRLQRHPLYDLPIPHVYNNKKDPTLPFLCLFDPAKREWTLDDLIAETTIPWTSTYLLFYEAWLLTGKWFAKERHPADTDPVAHKKRSPAVRRHEDGPSTAALLAGR